MFQEENLFDRSEAVELIGVVECYLQHSPADPTRSARAALARLLGEVRLSLDAVERAPARMRLAASTDRPPAPAS